MIKPNKPAKRHHFIPQMMLRHFTNAEGKLWFWRREFEKGDVKTSGTNNLFVEKDLYTLVHQDGSNDAALEMFFANLEGHGAKFIADLAEIVRDDAVPALDNRAWEFWSHFLYYHLKRTPGFIAAIAEQENFDGVIKTTFEQIKKIRISTGVDPNEQGLEQRIGKNAVVMAQRAAPCPEVMETFSKMGLVIYRIADARKSFIVGDVPGATAKFRLPNNNISRPTMFLPLTWDIAIGQLDKFRKVEIIKVDRDQIRRMNIASAERSTLIAGRSEALVKSLSSAVIHTGVLPV